MGIIALMYHDVLDSDHETASGFSGAAAASYKIPRRRFEEHLCAIEAALGTRRVGVLDAQASPESSSQVLLTFDDGGISALETVAPLLARHGWLGHFFVTTDCIGLPGFLGLSDVRTLHDKGHVIGTHSCSHPARVGRLPMSVLIDEWRRSRDLLSQLIDADVVVGSVPGAYYTSRVAEAAAVAGLQVLFNSEPTSVARRVGGCLVLGRYHLRHRSSARAAANFASGHSASRSRQAMAWQIRKALRTFGGPTYGTMTRLIHLAARQHP